jgi:hypothetical protein
LIFEVRPEKDRAMRTLRNYARWVGVVVAGVGLLAFAGPQRADACGGFFVAKVAALPSLQVEQVLIVHDPVKEQEHFIRQITFRDSNEHFGFVVPVPSLPTVAKVTGDPFVKLEQSFPMSGWPPPPGSIGGMGHGAGKGAGQGFGSGGSVNVLSTQKVGSFTAFVLEASDGKAMKKWLDDNGLVTTPASEAWLQHYTEIEFLFVAFRFEPPKDDPKPAATGKNEGIGLGAVGTGYTPSRVRSETVRISFATPLPFYPYLEPTHPDKIVAEQQRVLAVWLISQSASRPIAAVREGDEYAWKKPWKEGKSNPMISADIVKANLGAGLSDLLPVAAEYSVQRFEDQKSVREGWGDVVMVPTTPLKLDAAAIDKRRKLMSALDPTLRGAK